MDKTTKYPVASTRVSRKDSDRIDKCAKRRKQTRSRYIHDAILGHVEFDEADAKGERLV